MLGAIKEPYEPYYNKIKDPSNIFPGKGIFTQCHVRPSPKTINGCTPETGTY